MRCSQVVDVDQFERVIVAARDNGAQGAEEIEGFEFVEDEREDVVMRGHFYLFLLLLLPFFFKNLREFASQKCLKQHHRFARS